MFRGSPISIVGDFNMQVNESATMSRWQGTGAYIDVHKKYAGDDVPMTTYDVNGLGRRIDHVWCNELAAGLVSSVRLVERVFATHHSICVRFSVGGL